VLSPPLPWEKIFTGLNQWKFPPPLGDLSYGSLKLRRSTLKFFRPLGRAHRGKRAYKKRPETSRILISRKLQAGASSPRREWFDKISNFFRRRFVRGPRAHGKSTGAYRAVYCDCGIRCIRIARIKSCEYRRGWGSFPGTLADEMAAAAVDSRSRTDEKRRFRASRRQFTSNAAIGARVLGNRFASTERSRGIEDSLEGASDQLGDFIPAFQFHRRGPAELLDTRVRDRARSSAVEYVRLTEKGSLGEPFRQWV